ncbi:MAG: class I SAM-dependent methyltransferase [Chloroflexi bacterium]|nr:class I SAM-dependent methyltransferase [Chloroflexota bacterium]MCY3936840.1 class I SAM-dependent methyltransferase [Chloroflexota bacterium]
MGGDERRPCTQAASLFDAKSAAWRYARGRPYHQDVVIERVKARLNLDGKLDRALDVACGTGLSCIALKGIAKKVCGFDISVEMLEQAERNERIDYAVCPAERLAMGDAAIDLVTVSSAFHWFDRDVFLAEAKRVLRPLGWLVIYNSFFFSRMKENADFGTWFTSTHLKEFPTPPRDNRRFDEDDAERAGFTFVEREWYTNDVSWDASQLVDYLLTQTNVSAVVEDGSRTLEEVREYLVREIGPFFPATGRGTFEFGGPIWYLRSL